MRIQLHTATLTGSALLNLKSGPPSAVCSLRAVDGERQASARGRTGSRCSFIDKSISTNPCAASASRLARAIALGGAAQLASFSTERNKVGQCARTTDAPTTAALYRLTITAATGICAPTKGRCCTRPSSISCAAELESGLLQVPADSVCPLPSKVGASFCESI